MQKIHIKLLLYYLVMCVITGFVVCEINSMQQKKIAVIDAVKLFEGYHMTKDLESLDKIRLQTESKEMDSLIKMAQIARAMHNEEDAKMISDKYIYAKSVLENDYAQSNHSINEKVWKRLNPILEEFGKKKGLHLIIGANGMGSVLYNDGYYDLTSDVINFANKRYEEGN
ncbi:MAG: OmpH family outer membrane protein [Flavipsychrobacter sp.]|nr:OmpH family outer membrane protein [Flavipsychrobacter sp.]